MLNRALSDSERSILMAGFIDKDEDRKQNKTYQRTTPDILSAFQTWENAVFASEDREIPRKYIELIAVAVALTTQCGYCIDAHSKAAVKHGASETELAETAWIAAGMRAGAAYAHGWLALRLGDEEAHKHL